MNLIIFSDHLPIIIKALIDEDYRCKTDTPMSAISWSKLDHCQIAESYTCKVNHNLNKLVKDIESKLQSSDKCNAKDVDQILKVMINSMQEASCELPRKTFNKHLKPYWNANLNVLSKENKQAWWNWVNAGRPRYVNNQVLKRYKACKKAFKHAQKQAQYDLELKEMEELKNNQDINTKFFWHLVNKR